MKIDTTKQKFQIGDICKIVRADNSIFTHPKIKDEKTTGYGLYIMIVGSYAQIFPNINQCDVNNYEIYVPYHLNKQIFSYDGSSFVCKIPNGMCCSNDGFIGTGWAWITAQQLDFIRKPNERDWKSLKNYTKTQKWIGLRNYTRTQEDMGWNSWEEMAKQYITKEMYERI